MRILFLCGIAGSLLATAAFAETTGNPLYNPPVGEGTNPMHTGDSLKAGPHKGSSSDASAGKGNERAMPVDAANANKGDMSNAQSNPLYKDKTRSGENPLSER